MKSKLAQSIAKLALLVPVIGSLMATNAVAQNTLSTAGGSVGSVVSISKEAP